MERKDCVVVSQLPKYIDEVRNLMIQKNYSPNTIRGADAVWRDIIEFSSSKPSQAFDENFCQSFFERYSHYETDSCYPFYQLTRYTYMLSDYIKFGVIFRVFSKREESFDNGYITLFTSFMEEEKQKRNLSDYSVNGMRAKLFRFQDYLIDTGAKSFNEVTQEQVNTYVLSIAHYSTTYTSECLRLLRRLSVYAYENGYCTKSFEATIPFVSNIRQQKLPSIFTDDEIIQIEKTIDRSNPNGKRDYAIFMIAARLGIRRSDIARLQLSNINWKTKEVSFSQQKTGRTVSLPLPDDVGWAIIDYLKNGRPETNSKNIFVSHRYPFENLANIDSVIPRLMRNANIKVAPDKRIGLHALRHGLATRMLENDVPMPIISQTLGHADIKSTEVYIRVSITQLSKCGLEVEL
ncbi:site-specific integrase [Eubacterium sp.]|uniref:site-specific integrase n=1 Tax=Eubacterium sp. TaxID=142586 RepID=UPI0025831921|nr:site-specific integrase [Eubacterium sp.]MCR5366980.1 tyrosine-type recombinase/integrase [Eubacterium sp.]